MPSSFNYLRTFRKKSHLTQTDIAFITNLNTSMLSRCEKGIRQPGIEMIIVYHVLFRSPIEPFFRKYKEMAVPVIVSRIELLVSNLEKRQPTALITQRITFLKATLKGLSINESP